MKACFIAAIVPAFALSGASLAQSAAFPMPPSDWPAPVHDNPSIPFIFLDRFEYRLAKGADARMWDVQGWVGGDYDKLWVKSEGESKGARTEQGDLQALYARRVSPFWYLQSGVRAHLQPEPSRNSLVLAVQGLAPYWFDVEASAFLDEQGRLSARFEAAYDLLFSQRLVLQPRIESNFSAAADRERGLGSGLNDIELGLRLRYEFYRQFAPYIGVNWSRKVGGTAREQNEEIRETSIVIGVRAWF